MIEAIPSSSDSITLIITKVEDPEELDTRFSKFTPAGDSDTLNSNVLEKLQGADEFFDLLNKVKEVASEAKDPEPKETVPAFPVRLFSFDTLDSVIEASRLLAPFYTGANTLYKDEENNNTFILALAPADGADQEFNKVCNMLSEYSSPEKGDSSVLAFEDMDDRIYDDEMEFVGIKPGKTTVTCTNTANKEKVTFTITVK